jgi:SAM-dependent methyltransferase
MTELRREHGHWERLAASDPMWVILTEPGKENAWDAREFFASGQKEIATALGDLERLGLSPSRGVAADFGCGLGRLTQALAEHFQQVHGIDISETMVAQAATHNRHGDRVRYHANVLDALPMLASQSVDFLYSRITLQHIPRAAAERYIAEFGRALAPGGVCMFQVPVRARSRLVRVRSAIRNMAPALYRKLRDMIRRGSHWEMNTIPESVVVRILEGSGLRVREVLVDGSAGDSFDSRMFIAARPIPSRR